MNKIKLAYDWIGPYRVYDNNQTFTISSPLYNLRSNDLSHEYFKKVNGYVPSPSILLNQDDVFIYEFAMGLGSNHWFSNPHADLLQTSTITAKTVEHIIKNKGYILLELGRESLFDEKMIYHLHEYFRKVCIPLNKVIFQVGNPDAHNFYDRYCTAKGISKAHRMFISTIEYFEFQVSFQMAKNKIMEEPRNLNYEHIIKTFLCFNRNHRFHRNNLALMFYKTDLLKNSFFSMTKFCPYFANDLSITSDFTKFVKKEYYSNCDINDSDIENFINMLPLTIDLNDVTKIGPIVNNWGATQSYYKQSLISVVTETFFIENIIFNTEKIWNPISYKHPFILVAAPRSLKYLKKLGYKTFSEFWDESYDEIDDHSARLYEIVKLCKDIDSWSEEKRRKFFHESMYITEHNYNLLKSIYAGELGSKRFGFWHNFRDAFLHNNGVINTQINPLST